MKTLCSISSPRTCLVSEVCFEYVCSVFWLSAMIVCAGSGGLEEAPCLAGGVFGREI